MMSMFSNMVKDTIEVLMDDLLIMGDSFDDYMAHLANVIQQCEDVSW